MKLNQKGTNFIVRSELLYREKNKSFRGLGRSWRYLCMRVLKGWRLLYRREDGRGKQVPDSTSHSDKQVGQCVSSVSIQFNRVRVLNLRKLCMDSDKPDDKITKSRECLFWCQSFGISKKKNWSLHIGHCIFKTHTWKVESLCCKLLKTCRYNKLKSGKKVCISKLYFLPSFSFWCTWK